VIIANYHEGVARDRRFFLRFHRSLVAYDGLVPVSTRYLLSRTAAFPQTITD
jgi:hypothetical protein